MPLVTKLCLLGMLRYLQRDATACQLQQRLRTAHDKASTQTNKKRRRGSQCTVPPAKRRVNATGDDRTLLKWSEAERREDVNSLASTSYNALGSTHTSTHTPHHPSQEWRGAAETRAQTHTPTQRTPARIAGRSRNPS